MLKVGVIGYGDRIAGLVKQMRNFDIPFQITAITDPRAEALKASGDENVKTTKFYSDADEMLAQEKFDGIMIGTRDTLHTPMAIKVAARNYPLFLEKAIAVSFEQLVQLKQAFEKSKSEVVVSFPLRLSPLVQQAKEIIDSGQIGTVEHVIAVNDVPYGTVYYNHWYRDYNEVGGLFLQKATHDFDYMAYLVDQKPKQVAAMNAQRVYSGDKPENLKCKDCDEQFTCPESPFNLYFEQNVGQKVEQTDWRLCVFSKGLGNEDLGNCLIEYANGIQASYTQNFFARHQAARRGARLYGYKGTIDFDWYLNELKVYGHQRPKVDTIKFTGDAGHFGGDTVLCRDWLFVMLGKMKSHSPLQAGIESTLTCLWARKSAVERKFFEINWPKM